MKPSSKDERVIPKVMDSKWKLTKANTRLDIQAFFVLQDDIPSYNADNPPFIVMANDTYFRTPKYMWSQGRELIQHLHQYKAPALEHATLKEWMKSILESDELLSEGEEETEP